MIILSSNGDFSGWRDLDVLKIIIGFTKMVENYVHIYLFFFVKIIYNNKVLHIIFDIL